MTTHTLRVTTRRTHGRHERDIDNTTSHPPVQNHQPAAGLWRDARRQRLERSLIARLQVVEHDLKHGLLVVQYALELWQLHNAAVRNRREM